MNMTLKVDPIKERHIKTIHELLGLSSEDLGLDSEEAEAKLAPAPFSLPVQNGNFAAAPAAAAPAKPASKSAAGKSKTEMLRYPMIFLAALGFFYVILNFRAVTSQISGTMLPPRQESQAFVAEDPDRFEQWMKNYYVYAHDPTKLLPDQDADRDGLTNRDEFYLGTNPLKHDTDQDGYDDGREILNGYNPLYEGKLTSQQSKIIAERFDLETIASRKGITRVAGAGLRISSTFQLDPLRPGLVEIPKLGVSVPVIWSRSFAAMESDLKFGAVHHPETPYPGESGTASIHGHSSGYPWDGNFKYAFTKINFLESGDEVFVTVYDETSASKRYRYEVRSKKVFAKDDPAQFADLGGVHLNLSTSWPIGSMRERYVVITELVDF